MPKKDGLINSQIPPKTKVWDKSSNTGFIYHYTEINNNNLIDINKKIDKEKTQM